MEILIAVILLILGLVVGYLFGSRKTSRSNTQVAILKAQMEEAKKFFSNTQAEKDRIFADTLQRQEQHSKESLHALQQRFDETVAKMKAELENATAEMLKKRQNEFESSNISNMSRILEPLNINIKQMREAVNENTNRHAKLGGELANNLQMVMKHSDAARESAEKLSEALRGGGKVQGDWGETVLTELLESQGLKEGIHFDTQTTLTDGKGKAFLSEETSSRMRPDVILHLDKERDIIIDAKVSLTAFLDYVNADTEEKRAVALKRHIDSIDKHVRDLAKKDYSSYVAPPKIRMNYVIMFVPTTAALYLATSVKSDLWRKAMEQGVYIADEQTLYAALRIIDMTWRQIAQAENHEKVYKLAEEMMSRVSAFIDKFSTIGNKLSDAQKAYDDAFSKLKDSGTSIPVTCRKLVKLGAKPKKIPKGVDPVLIGLSDDDVDSVDRIQ